MTDLGLIALCMIVGASFARWESKSVTLTSYRKSFKAADTFTHRYLRIYVRIFVQFAFFSYLCSPNVDNSNTI